MSNIREAVMDLERHAAEQGWDRPLGLYALVPTVDLLAAEPALAEMLGVTGTPDPKELTPVEQDPLPTDLPLEEALGRIMWPEGVAGCALVMERLVVKGSDETLAPGEDATADGRETEEIRMVAGVLRDGARHCAMRMRSHDEEKSVLNGADLIPALTSALALTLDLDG
ncbi:PPA1309 family protein [Nocardiopsis lambiniae]|uniref:PPA1309 family protein n=1 Tax=Nocardiopsis lambiniae TaxID=3075539 RepID=A0ABU2MGD6_9ACTN|nr:PPA1309 family protein [Nocardiopsis sp. DSM 44743]MDT0331600.1 PPA1309 family protein [Nocardiopsis sp. DSM 44743]